MFKTRSLAAAACRGGHVEVNDRAAKAATTVRVGDRVSARLEHRTRDLEVTRLIDKRVGPPVAVTCFIDHSPPPEPREADFVHRDPGAGRPTKRDRRQINRLRGR
jgi:ribosome-associated heat shock protein Hsp15